MSSNHLFIIGNGFDLWHKLPTSYKEFYQQYKQYLDQIEHYFSDGLQEEELWSDFENVLGQFDDSVLIGENDFMDFSGNEFPTQQMYGLEDAVYDFSRDIINNITDSFTEWLKGISLNKLAQQMVFPNQAKYISFNYTSTLQQLYAVPEADVNHIHGSLGKSGRLIFGHTQTVVYARAEEDSYYTEAINHGRKVLEVLQKPVNDIIRSNLTPWLNANKNISVITVIGHSLNNIDLPYFSRIVKEFPDAHWQCYSFNKKEALTHSSILQQIGVPKKNLRVGTYTDLVQDYPV
ncbi:MAG: bacteriophage abortive infection AbiH family protein [Vibrio sp.]